MSPFSIWMTCSTAAETGDVAALASGWVPANWAARSRARGRRGGRAAVTGWAATAGRRQTGPLPSGPLPSGRPPQGRWEQRQGREALDRAAAWLAVDRHRGQEEVFLGQLLVEIPEGRDLDDRRMPGNVEIRLGRPQGDGKAHEGDAEGEGEGATGKGPLGGYAGSRSQLLFPSVQWFGRQGSNPCPPISPSRRDSCRKSMADRRSYRQAEWAASGSFVNPKNLH